MASAVTEIIRAIPRNLRHQAYTNKLIQVYLLIIKCSRNNLNKQKIEKIQICKNKLAADPTEVNRLRLMISIPYIFSSLLQSQNRPKTGLKRDLMDRAMEVLDTSITQSLRLSPCVPSSVRQPLLPLGTQRNQIGNFEERMRILRARVEFLGQNIHFQH